MRIARRFKRFAGWILGLALSYPALAESLTYHVAGLISLPDGGFISQATFDPIERRLYIARLDEVTAVDVDSGHVVGKFVPADHGHAVLALHGGSEILVTDGASNRADIYATSNSALLASLQTGDKPEAALFDSTTGLAVVVNAGGGTVSLIDTDRRRVVGSIQVGGDLELAADDGHGRIYVNVEDSNELVAVDLKRRKVLWRMVLSGCVRPSGAGYLPVAQRVLSSCHNGIAAVIDPRRRTVERRLPIGKAPAAVIYDSRRRRAFVPAANGELDIFADDPHGVHALGSIKTRFGARTGALDEKTGRVYLPAADFDLPVRSGVIPELKPGTVVAVVVEP